MTSLITLIFGIENVIHLVIEIIHSSDEREKEKKQNYNCLSSIQSLYVEIEDREMFN